MAHLDFKAIKAGREARCDVLKQQRDGDNARSLSDFASLSLEGRRGMRKPIITCTTSLTLRDTMQRLQLFTWTGTKSAWLSVSFSSQRQKNAAAVSVRADNEYMQLNNEFLFPP